MKICEDAQEKKTTLIGGHLYKHENGHIFLGTADNSLIHLDDGHYAYYIERAGFCGYENSWEDVTDQYCLKKVK